MLPLRPTCWCLNHRACVCVQNISVQIEQPFAVLPLDAFCRTMKANLRHMEGSRTQALQLLSGELQKTPPAVQPLMV